MRRSVVDNPVPAALAADRSSAAGPAAVPPAPTAFAPNRPGSIAFAPSPRTAHAGPQAQQRASERLAPPHAPC